MTGTMHFLKRELEFLTLDVFLQISKNSYVGHKTHLIVGNLNFFERKKGLLPFLLISMQCDAMSHHCVRKKVGFSALVQQEMFKRVDIGV